MFFAPNSICHEFDVSPTDCFAGGKIIQAIQKKADTDCSDDMGQDVPEIIHGHDDTEQSQKQILGNRYLIGSLIDNRNDNQSRCHETIQHAAEREAVRHENDHIQHTIQSLD